MEKFFGDYRNYTDDAGKVQAVYKEMYQNQTLPYVLHQKSLHRRFPKPFTINEALDKLDTIVDESDPDTDAIAIGKIGFLANQSLHAVQAAQAMEVYLKEMPIGSRKIQDVFNENEWNNLPIEVQEMYQGTLESLYPILSTDETFLIVTAFLHDFGKLLLVAPKSLPQWSVVGDTFVLGLPLPESAPYSVSASTCTNHVYTEFCGFDQLIISYGHDEYMASVLEHSYVRLPKEAIYLIRYHSLYPWHSPRDGRRAYEPYANEEDWRMLPLLKIFQKCDLYSKLKEELSEECKEKYIQMTKKYVDTFYF